MVVLEDGSDWAQSSTWFVEDLRHPVTGVQTIGARSVWLSGVPYTTAVSETGATQVRQLIEPKVGPVSVVTIRTCAAERRAMVFAGFAFDKQVEMAEKATVACVAEDGTSIELQISQATVDDEISRVRHLRQRSDDVAQSLAQPDTTLSVANIPNGGHGIGDNRKLAEIFMDEVYEDVGDVPVVSVIVMEAKGLRNDRAYVTYASAEAAAACAVRKQIAFWDPVRPPPGTSYPAILTMDAVKQVHNQDALIKATALGHAVREGVHAMLGEEEVTDAVAAAAAGELPVTSSRQARVAAEGKSLWEDASTRQATFALQWFDRVQNLDEDEVRMRREEREAREAEEAAAREEEEAAAAEAEAEAKEEQAWLAEERMRREEAEAHGALRRAHDEELEAKQAIIDAEREEQEAQAASAEAAKLQREAREAQEFAAKEAAEAEAAKVDAEREAAEAEEAERAAEKEEAEANAAVSDAAAAETETRALYMKANVEWGSVEEVEKELAEAKAALESAKGKKVTPAQNFLSKLEVRAAKRKKVEELKALAAKEVAEADEARAIAITERKEAFDAKRDAVIEASEAEDAQEVAAERLKKANEAMRVASFERAEAEQAKRNAEREVEEAKVAKRLAEQELEEFTVAREAAGKEREKADELRKIAAKERAEADEATAVAIKERSEANAAKTKWVQKQTGKMGGRWMRKAAKGAGADSVLKKAGKAGGGALARDVGGRHGGGAKFGQARLWSASGKRPLTSTVNFGNTAAYAAIDAGKTHTKIVVGLDCALVPTGDATEAAKAALAAQHAKARVDRRAGVATSVDTAAQVAELEALSGDAQVGRAIKAVLTPRALVSQIVYQDAWFHRGKNGANGKWAGSPSATKLKPKPPRQPHSLPELSPRYQRMMDRRRQAIVTGRQHTLALPLNMRLPDVKRNEGRLAPHLY